MRSVLAMALVSASTLFVIALASPGCSSSSTTPPGDGGGGMDSSKDTGGGGKDSGKDTGGMKDTGGGKCGDAGGLLPAACISCLESNCTAQFKACTCDSMCIDIIKCLDVCVMKGMSAMNCALSCASSADAGPGGEALALLSCAQSSCMAASGSMSGCSTPSEGGVEGGGD